MLFSLRDIIIACIRVCNQSTSTTTDWSNKQERISTTCPHSSIHKGNNIRMNLGRVQHPAFIWASLSRNVHRNFPLRQSAVPLWEESGQRAATWVWTYMEIWASSLRFSVYPQQTSAELGRYEKINDCFAGKTHCDCAIITNACTQRIFYIKLSSRKRNDAMDKTSCSFARRCGLLGRRDDMSWRRSLSMMVSRHLSRLVLSSDTKQSSDKLYLAAQSTAAFILWRRAFSLCRV